uniref:Ig-like domain-containing protein n=1 Tax=Terrapene triunguis TaxID=2587831 RepID=A0A674K591_9SAUR
MGQGLQEKRWLGGLGVRLGPRRSGPAPDPSLPRPSISLSPTGITAPGADVTIRCQGQRRNVTFFLHKAGDLNPQQHMDPAGDGAEFLIPTVGRQHGGSYSCSYRPRSEPFVSSQPSDTVQLVVAGEGYPKPNISLSPRGVSRGGAVTVRCWGQRRGMRFVLNKDGRHFQAVDSDRFEAVFSINMSREHSGNYSCSYHSRSEPDGAGVCLTACLLLIVDLRYPKPSISLRPSGEVALGGAVTVRCWGRHQNMRFLLYKDGNPNFPIRNVSRRDAGSYSCYHHDKVYQFIWSHPSDPVCLLLTAETTYSKPSISLHPSREVTPGEAVTVRCQAQYQNMRFLLYKDGNPTAVQEVEPAGNMAEFPIRNVSRRDAGSYRCRYSNKTDPPASSHPSDPVELVVAGSALSPGPSRGDARLGGRDGINDGFPSKGQQQQLKVQGRGRGDPCPRGSCRAGGLSQGAAPLPSPGSGDAQRSQGPGAAQPPACACIPGLAV